MNKILRNVFLVAVMLIANASFADTYTYTFTSGDANKNGSCWLQGIVWTVNSNSTYFGNVDKTKGQQYGSGSSPATSLVLSTTKIPGTISSIKVNTSGASSIKATLEVKVGGTTFGENYTLTTTATDVTFTGSAKGEVSLNYTQTSSKAIYIKSIEITTDEDIIYEDEQVEIADNIAEFKALASGTKAELRLKDAVVQYVNGNDMYVADATGGIDFYKSDLTYIAGQTLNGSITATYKDYNSLPELTDIESNKLEASDEVIDVTPVEMSVAEAANVSNACKLVKITNVTAVSIDSKYYTDEDKTIQIYNKFNLNYTPDTEKAHDYVGIIIPYNKVIEIAPTEAPITTGISSLSADEAVADAPAYNLAGQKVTGAYKGVVVKGGKKFVQK